MRVVKHCNRLPREVVEAPFLETFKARLDGGLSNLVCREAVEAPFLETFKARLDGGLSNLVWLVISLLTGGGVC